MGPPTQVTTSTPSVGVFFSPPEAPKPDSFTASDAPYRDAPQEDLDIPVTLPPFRSLFSSVSHSPLSPPVSPLVGNFNATDHEPPHRPSHSSVPDKDYELFPHKSLTVSDGVTPPLFQPVEPRVSVEPPDVIDLHIRSRRYSDRPSPTRKEYELAVNLRSTVLEKYMADPAGWYKQEQEYLKAYPPRFPQKATGDNPSGSKRKATDDTRPAKRSRPAAKSLTEKLPAPKRAVRPPPRDLPSDHLPQQPVVKHRRKVSRATPTPREDMDYHKVHDFSPHISTMAPGKNLKIDWKGHPLDLSSDPDRHELDDAEIQLASVLRLTAAQYLYAKRKIFERFVELSRIGKDFNKTSAQGVCKIDVNKASKLWTAFDKVGWFDKRLFSQYLQ